MVIEMVCNTATGIVRRAFWGDGRRNNTWEEDEEEEDG